MTWLFNDELLDIAPEDYVGFVYEITDLRNSKIYIGKKKFWATRTLPPLKGKKRKRRKIIESDWKSYYGSSEEVKSLLEANGPGIFKRKILRLCKTTAELSYYELKEQMTRDVLLYPERYYNAFVGAKINRSHLKHLWIDD